MNKSIKTKSKVFERLLGSKEEYCITFIFMFLDELVKKKIITPGQKAEASRYYNDHLKDKYK